MPIHPIHVIGAGLAGSEAAWAVARAGVPVILHEMRPVVGTDVHQTGDFAELRHGLSDQAQAVFFLAHISLDHQRLYPMRAALGGNLFCGGGAL